MSGEQVARGVGECEESVKAEGMAMSDFNTALIEAGYDDLVTGRVDEDPNGRCQEWEGGPFGDDVTNEEAAHNVVELIREQIKKLGGAGWVERVRPQMVTPRVGPFSNLGTRAVHWRGFVQ